MFPNMIVYIVYRILMIDSSRLYCTFLPPTFSTREISLHSMKIACTYSVKSKEIFTGPLLLYTTIGVNTCRYFCCTCIFVTLQQKFKKTSLHACLGMLSIELQQFMNFIRKLYLWISCRIQYSTFKSKFIHCIM